jgi:ubiquinone/menaquinone biosynthesis C-methylase UbiE
MRRTVAAELLDSDLGTPREIEASLADLRLVNRWFGGIATTRSLLERILYRRNLQSKRLDGPTSGSPATLLDVGSGSGDVPLTMARQLRAKNIELRVVLLDRSPGHLGNFDLESTRIAADACALPFRDASVDLVSCALLAHHLEPEEIVGFVNEALRVTRVAVLINDLRRSWMHLAAVYAGFACYSSRLTRHDAPASVRRAYTRMELKAILQRTQAREIEIHNHYLFRMGAIVWKNAPATWL